MRIAIIGASGNVGTALLRRLQQERLSRAEPLELVGVSRRVPDSSKKPFGNVLWHSLDVGLEEDKALLRAALEGVDAVVHLAWVLQPNHDLEQLYRTNVTGTANMLQAAKEAGVGHIVCASSLGAYSSGSKESRVDESWPATGIPGSHYSRHKAEQERLLDRFAAENPSTVVARLRPALTFQRDAGSEIGRYFLGPLIPKLLLASPRTPILPVPEQFVFQAVHADDVADAYWRVLERRAEGAFNVAAEPVVTPVELARLFHAKRWLPIPIKMVHAAAGFSWRLHLQRSDAGWVDMAEGAPIMDTGRARELLGWEPRISSLDAIKEVLAGMGTGQGLVASPALHPRPLLGPAGLRRRAMRKVALRSGELRSEALRRHAMRNGSSPAA